ncbi:hypothetical protein HNQ77_002161 [Silvibacterium bohemicum]|uniref:DUF2059 domain-containing protein n=1 Tax=Silvibacterium bohemicum TaxID=1577686 RepID=A0A841JWW3_9BACT|nr:DUF2059 domain-containing protein [Silvibacterium bohemicum]MBB6144209.1 hypothetical protein [Silvibacterium bohemicum]
MRTAILSLSCTLLAGSAFAQSAAPAKPSTPAATAAPAAKAPVSTAPAHPLTDAQAQKMLEVTGADKMKEQMVHGMTNYFHSSLPFAPKDVTDDLQQSLEKDDLNASIIAIYKQHISTEDADSIIAFYKTPAGKNMMETLPEVLQQSQQAGMTMARKTAQDVVSRHRPEIEAAAKQYQQEHAPKPAPSLNAPGASAAPGSSSAPAAKPASPATTTPAPQQ